MMGDGANPSRECRTLVAVIRQRWRELAGARTTAMPEGTALTIATAAVPKHILIAGFVGMMAVGAACGSTATDGPRDAGGDDGGTNDAGDGGEVGPTGCTKLGFPLGPSPRTGP